MSLLKYGLILMLVIFVGCSVILFEDDLTNNNVEDFEIAWNTVNDLYPLLEFKKINWDSIYNVYLPKVENSTGDEIYLIINDLLKELKDQHVIFRSRGSGAIMPYVSTRFLKDLDAYDPIIVRNYFKDELLIACNNTVEYGILDNNIGYIYIAHFNNLDQFSDFFNVMDYIKNTDALIIDERANSGGLSENLQEVVGWFLDSTYRFDSYLKDDVWYDGDDFTFHPHDIQQKYEKSIVVLINGACISSGELFPELMKQLPNVTLIGDTTAGALCNDFEMLKGDYFLSNGIMIHIGTRYIMRFDGIVGEWNGIEPDIYLPQSEEDLLNGQDKQLEFAIEYLSN